MERGADKLKKAIIGKEGNKSMGIDLEKLMRTRLLIQANSGGGKSYLIRKLLEETHGKVQHIVLDLEGEFATLREKYDYVLVGKDGDIPTDIRSAEMLAKKLLEHNISAIIDLYELKHHERILFVKRFLDAMVNARKELWHPVLVIVDEAHIFCPEKTKSESASSVIDLATRGRKRGYCAVLATQRLSKLHKDAAAECNNKLIGRTGLDVDMKRASEELGFTSKQQMLSLRDLEAGEFFAFGPAIAKQIAKVKIDNVKTTHPEAGMGVSIMPAPAGNNIKLILSKLVDLPKKAEDEQMEKSDLQKKIRELNQELRKAGTIQYSKVPAEKNQNDILNARKQGYSEAKKHYDAEFNKMRRNQTTMKHSANLIESNAKKILASIIESRKISIFDQKDFYECRYKSVPQINKEYGMGQKAQPSISPSISAKPHIHISTEEENNGMLKAGAVKMLKAIAMFHPRPVSKHQIAALSGFSVKGGTFGSYLSKLRKYGFVYEKGNEVHITEEGLKFVGDIPELPTDSHGLVEMWASKFKAGAAMMLRKVAEIYPREISKEELGEATGFSVSGGTFGSYLSVLRKNNLVEIEDQMVKASKTLFLEDL